MRRFLLTTLCLQMAAPAITSLQASEIPEPVLKVIADNCLECHDSLTEKGEVNLESTVIEWTNIEEMDLWLRALEAIEDGLMPPPEQSPLTEAEIKTVASYLDQKALEHIPIGGTLPRRLNRTEYENTIRSLVFLPKFTLPDGFPKDTEFHGFYNVGDGLVLSPAHLEAYAKVATSIADRIFPPEKPTPEPKTWEAGPEDMVLSFSAATVHDDALRLVSRSVDIMRSCTWPSRIEISDSGRYEITVEASKFLSEKGHSFEDPMRLEVYARPVSATDRSRVEHFRLLEEFEISSEEPQKNTLVADLFEGETVLFRWANAEMTHAHKELAALLKDWFEEDPRFLAAWQKAVFPKGTFSSQQTTSLRGRNGWDIISKHWGDADLDMSRATMEEKMTRRVLEIADSQNGTFNFADALCHFYHERGPALEIHKLTIQGPSETILSQEDLARAKLQERIVGKSLHDASNEAIAETMLRSFLPRAFRRPVDETTVQTYLSLAKQHWAEEHSLEEGLHLLLRNILISPRFLYRSLAEGKMDDFDLATRLSYFLTSGPPDSVLLDLAKRNRLSPTAPSKTNPEKQEYWVLRREAERLLPKRYTDPFVQNFVGQWLDTASLSGIMPDPKFNFGEESTRIAKYETERSFTEILLTNRPLTDFIAPNFTFSTYDFVVRNYKFTPPFALEEGVELDKTERRKFRKIKLDRGNRHGGLLGQSAIMMATANGVDTQPVIRGVWMLENILGMPPPEAPQNVPALTPDTRGSTTPRELLEAHTNDKACSACHKRIDPLGYLLENYDPVGRWRKEWPGTHQKIDSAATLPDGTTVADALELKQWLVENIDLFSECLAEKLMIYATGRVPNHAEKREIKAIVLENKKQGNRFKDLLLALIESETFRTH